jgi:hypothetical protein
VEKNKIWPSYGALHVASKVINSAEEADGPKKIVVFFQQTKKNSHTPDFC